MFLIFLLLTSFLFFQFFIFKIITIKSTRIQLCIALELWDNNTYVGKKNKKISFGVIFLRSLWGQSSTASREPIQAFCFLCLYMTETITRRSLGPRSEATMILAVSVVFCSVSPRSRVMSRVLWRVCGRKSR